MKKIILPIILLLVLAPAFSHPVQPCTFWGKVSIGDSKAPFGTEVLAYNSDGKICGTYVIGQKEDDVSGYYGFLSCVGKSINGDKISFKVNGVSAKIIGDSTWESGATKRVDLQASKLSGTNTNNNIYQYVETEDEAYYEVVGEEKQTEITEKKFYQNNLLLLSLSAVLVLLTVLFVLVKRKERQWT